MGNGKIGTYKEGNYITTYYGDGSIWQCMQNPFYPIKNWDTLPEGYKFPEPDYVNPLSNCRLEIMDFSTTPPTILNVDEYNKIMEDGKA